MLFSIFLKNRVPYDNIAYYNYELPQLKILTLEINFSIINFLGVISIRNYYFSDLLCEHLKN